MGKALMLPTIVLASASPARKLLLENAGIDPVIRVSNLDEDAIASENNWKTPQEIALGLAIAKANAVAKEFKNTNSIIIGCDSVMEFDGEPHGKPLDHDTALSRLKVMSGGSGHLHTGHCVIQIDGENYQQVSQLTSTEVVFHEMTAAEIDAYVKTGEPLNVAGSFTLDSLGGPFIKEIHGDPSNVIGLSLPTLRLLMTELGLGWEFVLKNHADTHK
ncbi:MAG: hypothetical protein RLZZ508_103 [Actinomycetota bacterium]|jgi:septum formation protein